MKEHIKNFDSLKNQQIDQEVDEATTIELEEDSGLKSYFKEIVRNANRFGEKIDLTQYSKLMDSYNEVG
jgi:hypothetical protein